MLSLNKSCPEAPSALRNACVVKPLIVPCKWSFPYDDESSTSSSGVDRSLQDHDNVSHMPSLSLLCLDFAILFDMDMLVGLKDTDFVFWELDGETLNQGELMLD